ncbi:MAG: sugar ABC transporter permease [Clostridiaceae bacterium]|nr:sugar ABC transporter permease [Clostridiaceae bacterium]
MTLNSKLQIHDDSKSVKKNNRSTRLGSIGIIKKLRIIRKDYLLYLLAVPGIFYFLLFKYVPMYGVTIAFRDYNIFKGLADSPFVGFKIFEKLFGLPAFNRALVNTVIISFAKIIFGFPAPIILSLMINEVVNVKYKKFVQTSLLLPSFISWVVIAGIMYVLFSPNSGIIKGIATFMGYTGRITDIMGSKSSFRYVIVLSDIWKSMGMGTIVYLAAISGIDQELYEAAIIDGAGKWRQMWHITLASLRSTIVILLIMRVGGILNAGFDQIFTLYNPLVYEVSEIIDTYVYKVGILQHNFSIATAADLFKSVVGLTMVLLTNAIAKRIDESSGII